jgi:hypothetical protein
MRKYKLGARIEREALFAFIQDVWVGDLFLIGNSFAVIVVGDLDNDLLFGTVDLRCPHR